MPLPTFPVLWIANLRRINEGASHLLALLSPAEKARRLRFRHAADQQRFMVGRALTRLAIASQLSCAAQEISIVITTSGKPKLDPNPASLAFSIAHSGDLVVLALVAEGTVGVDVEQVTSEVAPDLMMPMVCSRLESDGVKSLPSHRQQVKRLLSLWTLKEAYLKATGTGLATDPREVVFGFDAQGQPALLGPPRGELCCQFTDRWGFIVMPDYGEYVLALAVHHRSGHVVSSLSPVWGDADTLFASARGHQEG
ncbi:4'-phosphopantetheinyl transferase superfamily protein [Glaciimonas sp. PAMC28666]|uniref:4'-phosphopantetheinyl transferase family protein n=1 Tax=Glaciimonas sp. PAMC28666 TaxID=2807626 RepID=UPI0019654D3A|nr:4'-phosphopantetheinyl transferase superfamily protein [Glaciimonas sp. PAMC28666]QRX82721.1 4'-phosphopantetheinyl transferase superfamily protein [Glaciimonas sp. PAMC28666]